MYWTAIFSEEGQMHFGKVWTSASQVTGMQVEIHGSAQYLYKITLDDLIVLFKCMNLLIVSGEYTAKCSIKKISCSVSTLMPSSRQTKTRWVPHSLTGGCVLCTVMGGSSAGPPDPRAPGSRPVFCNSHYTITYLIPSLSTLSWSI